MVTVPELVGVAVSDVVLKSKAPVAEVLNVALEVLHIHPLVFTSKLGLDIKLTLFDIKTISVLLASTKLVGSAEFSN